jgi:putative methionine-R-sulfoxide reductase with GAF domain
VSPKGEDPGSYKAQLDQMTSHLVAVERRAQTLAELNRLLTQGRDPLPFAQRAVDLVMRATGAALAFIYLWDPELQRLVLRVATVGRQSKHVGQIQLRLGEGITGWSGLMRQTVVLDDNIQQDARFASIPVLDEDGFRSMVAAPIAVPGGDVLGVFSLWSTEPATFDHHDVNLATEVGGLVASGLLQARTVEDLRRQSAAARFLTTVPADTTRSLQRCVDVLAASVRDQVDAAMCTIELADRGGPVSVRAGIAFAEHADASLVVASRSVRTRSELLSLAERLVPDQDRFSTSFGQLFPIGAITCYRHRPFSEADTNIIEALAAQAAALIASMSNPAMIAPLAGRLASTDSVETAEQILRDLGWRPGSTRPLVVRMASADLSSPAAFNRLVEAMHEICSSLDGVVLAPSAPMVSMLIRHEPEHWKAFEQLLRGTLRSLSSGSDQGLSAGIGPVANEADQISEGLKQAEFALGWAELLGDWTRIVYYQDVAHLKVLPRVAMDFGDSLRDAIRRLTEVVRYDLRHGTTLFATLDTYFAHRCSATDTSNELFIHRNTLRQRLARVEELAGRSPEDLGDWTVVALATRITAAGAVPNTHPS